jgi:DNA ligase-1
VLVPQTKVGSEDEAWAETANFVTQGYEGGMVKNSASPYENKRSYHIQKLKSMQDAEFRIVDAEEGRGKLARHVGSFVCEMPNGQRFNAKLKGKLDYLAHLFENPAEWQGKLLTVQYQNLSPDGVPRFPVGVAIRSYE